MMYQKHSRMPLRESMCYMHYMIVGKNTDMSTGPVRHPDVQSFTLAYTSQYDHMNVFCRFSGPDGYADKIGTRPVSSDAMGAAR
jgi:hypothetical protein